MSADIPSTEMNYIRLLPANGMGILVDTEPVNGALTCGMPFLQLPVLCMVDYMRHTAITLRALVAGIQRLVIQCSNIGDINVSDYNVESFEDIPINSLTPDMSLFIHRLTQWDKDRVYTSSWIAYNGGSILDWPVWASRIDSSNWISSAFVVDDVLYDYFEQVDISWRIEVSQRKVYSI